MLGWIIVEWLRNGKPTLVGASSGAVAGLVAITPACALHRAVGRRCCSASSPASVCALAVSLKYRLGFDDSLDVVGVHFVGGWIGSLWIGLFATTAVNSLGSTRAEVRRRQRRPVLRRRRRPSSAARPRARGIVTVWSFAVALVIGFVLKTIGLFRVKPEAEVEGIDIAEHKESAYDLSTSAAAAAAAARSPWPGSAREPGAHAAERSRRPPANR